MYSAFMLSGAVDLAAHWLGAPPGTELVRRGRGGARRGWGWSWQWRWWQLQ